ncbi:hypothetical protein M885DRAFT_625104 [Pelagophyceae sp. CCMP2097]|nr:hypothetical protein M885DRAFT_625104 [Pelagophyceae sp. CCMP2097]
MADLADALLASLPEKKQRLATAMLVGFQPREREVVVRVLLAMPPNARLDAVRVIDGLMRQTDAETCTELVDAFREAPDECQDLVALRKYLHLEPWCDVLRLPAEDRGALLRHVHGMADADRLDLGVRLGKGVVPAGALLELLDEDLDPRCTLCRFKRETEAYFIQCQGSDRARKSEKVLFAHSSHLYAFEREAAATPTTLDPRRETLLWRLGLDESDFGVFWGPELNGARRLRVDASTACDGCRAEVYAFMIEVGNDVELYHLKGAKKLSALQAKRDLDKHRAAWWTLEKHRTDLCFLLRCVADIQRHGRGRRKRAVVQHEVDLSTAAVFAKRSLELGHLGDLRAETRVRGHKWFGFDERERAEILRKRGLYAQLQNLRDPGDVSVADLHQRWQRVQVEDGGVSTRKREFDENGVPLTAEAAAHVFGTAPYVVEDETDVIRHAKREALAFENSAETTKSVFASHDAAVKRADFVSDVERWRDEANLVDDRRKKVEDQAAAGKAERARLRATKKVEMAALRDALRRDGLDRTLAGHEAERDLADRRRIQREVERRERISMTLEEAAQTAIDRFWGLPTALEKVRRADELQRLVWSSRVQAAHTVMRKTAAVAPLYKARDELERRLPPLADDVR